ncbi:hypothetical protein, conserved [Eimeria tenella]|uniref:Uncharacterized protein n=1 Tax=Eimeria tenella TaxID=5802 RepID=U6KPC8_EIMTE|nr:hypothetical protein, conserved [Eimeria tenella]CDJ38142.1 hypothetical protein, conserved [Eimeria tenella]|eukprot:XP_013228980.1 hypothetical protein, conserved [Eimeria tenella]
MSRLNRSPQAFAAAAAAAAAAATGLLLLLLLSAGTEAAAAPQQSQDEGDPQGAPGEELVERLSPSNLDGEVLPGKKELQRSKRFDDTLPLTLCSSFNCSLPPLLLFALLQLQQQQQQQQRMQLLGLKTIWNLFVFVSAVSPQENLKRLKDALGNSWLQEALRERGQEGCRHLKRSSGGCPAAAAAAAATAAAAAGTAAAGLGNLSTLRCDMQEIAAATAAAEATEAALLHARGDELLRCSRLLLLLLQYIDLMLLHAPFQKFKEGKSPKEALKETFAHWGLSPHSAANVQHEESRAALLQLQ